MKKILLLFALIIAFVCLLSVSIAAECYYTDWGETEEISDIGIEPKDVIKNVKENSAEARVKLICSCEKGYHTYPTYYIMSINAHLSDLFNRSYNNINEKNPCGASYDNNSIVALEIPEGIGSTYFSGGRKSTLSQHENVKYIKLPSTMHTIANYCFADSPKLEFVEFNPSCKIKSLQASAFNNCTSLVGASLPDSITEFGDACFIGCYNIGPVYLPKNLKNIGTTIQWNTFQGGEKGNGEKPTKLYFTNEWFTNPNDATKPKVYYMPSTLTYIDQCLRGATNINDVIVFPEGITKINDQTTFLGLGGTAENRKTIIFLGDITEFPVYKNETLKYTDFYFLNPNDNLSQGLSFHGITKTGEDNTNIKDVYIYSCADKKAMSLVDAYLGNDSWSEELFKHISDDSKSVSQDASCTSNQKITTFCFCKEEIETIEIENTALGHNNNTDSGATLIGISYTKNGKTDYMANGYKTITCARCNENNNDEIAQPLFSLVGISVNNEETAMCISKAINNDAIKEYERYNSKLSFGVVACYAGENNGNTAPLSLVNDAVAGQSNAITADITDKGYLSFDFKLNGFSSDPSCIYKNYGFIMSAYVYDGKSIYYLGENCSLSAKPISFNEILSFTTI